MRPARILAALAVFLAIAVFRSFAPAGTPAKHGPALPEPSLISPASRDARPPDPATASEVVNRIVPPIAACGGADGESFRFADDRVCATFDARGVKLALTDSRRRRGWGLRWGPVGMAETTPRPEGPLPGRVNLFVGDSSRWKSDLPTFGALRYPGVAPGVDLRIESRSRGMEYAVHAAAGANVESLRWRYEGAQSVTAIENGSALLIRTGVGVLREDGLLAYQEAPVGRRMIPAWYETNGTDEYFIRLGAHDAGRPLVIDPTIGWSTLLGGARSDQNTTPYDAGRAIARDAAGFLYITGYTECTDLPTTGGFDQGFSGLAVDAFVAKIDPAGPTIVWSSYLGGSRSDWGFAIGVDASFNVYVTGATDSFDFPTTGGFKTTLTSANTDAFITKIHSSGSRLLWSSYLGGDSDDQGWALAVDAAGDAYITGPTSSSNFPISGGFQTTFVANDTAGFLAKVHHSGSGLIYSSYLRGNPYALTIDGTGSAFVAGAAGIAGLATAGAYQTLFTGTAASFAMKVAPGGGSIAWFTYLGGNAVGNEVARAIQLDGAGNVYVGGETGGSAFPSAASFGTTPLQNGAGYVAKLNSTATTLLWSVLLGGTGPDIVRGLAVDASQNVIAVGETQSAEYPNVNAFQTGAAWDGFITKIAANGASLLWSSHLGGSGDDAVYGIVLDPAGNVYVVGDTSSSDFPVPNGFDTTYVTAGSPYPDAFVAKINAAGTAILWGSYYGGSQGPATDQGNAVTVDAAGNVYVTGLVSALDFPVPGAFDPSLSGQTEIFIVKLNPSGSALVWSSLLGGSGDDYPWGIALDGSARLFIVGQTTSADFPGLAGGFNGTLSGGQDGFLAQINLAGPTLAWSSLLGGSGIDSTRALVVDASGDVTVCGQTYSTDFPIVGGFQTTSAGIPEAFVARIHPAGPTITWSSFLGGAGEEEAFALTLDSTGNVYVTGRTTSANFPTPGGVYTTLKGPQDAFVAKIASSGTSLLWASYLGGIWWESGTGIGIDATGAVVVAGTTNSADFPIVEGFDSTLEGNDDAFVAAFAPDGSALLGSSLLGGRGSDQATGLVVRNGAAYVTGTTSSPDFPSVGGFDSLLGYEYDAFVVRVNPLLSGAGGGGGGGGGGSCGLIGLEALLSLALLAALRRR